MVTFGETEIRRMKASRTQLRVRRVLQFSLASYIVFFCLVAAARHFGYLIDLAEDNSLLAPIPLGILALTFLTFIWDWRSLQELSRCEVMEHALTGDTSAFIEDSDDTFVWRFDARTFTKYVPWAEEFVRLDIALPQVIEEKFSTLDSHWWNLWWWNTRRQRRASAGK